MEEQFEYFATCPLGFERTLADELKRLRVQRVRPLKGGVAFFGTRVDGYRACLWSRIASRVTRVLARVDASSAEALYRGVRAITWEGLVGEGATVAVSAHGTNDALRNTQFTALKVKDALCDRLRGVRGARPDVAPERPDVPVWVSIHGKKATVAIDYAGESLHRRGYRDPSAQVDAPLKEALAAGMLTWGGWDALAAPSVRRAKAARGEDPAAPAFVDPVCGGGTLVLEAAMMASDRAPGLMRDYWGFAGCADFDAEAFDGLLADADERFEAGLEGMPTLLGADIDARAVEIARNHARRLGMVDRVTFVQADCADLSETLAAAGIDASAPGFMALNPPYGMRLLAGGVGGFYGHLSAGLACLSDAWRMVAITPDASFDAALGLDAERRFDTYNGPLSAQVRSYRLGGQAIQEIAVTTLAGAERGVATVSEHAEQFAARLRKMARTRRKWARKHDIHAYRVYDADLPDYAVAVDVFEEAGTGAVALLVAEYQAPRDIDPGKAARRFRDAVAVTGAVFDVPEERVFTRVRRQDRGGSQYSDEAGRDSHRLIVEEAGHPFELDLAGYLDTGLFLDHRITRAKVAALASGARFLNLFAYTGSASVYAAAGGAASTTTVDMSQTYLDWARRNMDRSGFFGARHRFVRADVLAWVDRAVASPEERYDLVFVDPPTFSNSKTMGERTWDIQRDHAALLAKVGTLLNPGGTIVFSGNLRSFKLDEAALADAGLEAKNITAETIPEDFERNPRIHFCFLIERA